MTGVLLFFFFISFFVLSGQIKKGFWDEVQTPVKTHKRQTSKWENDKRSSEKANEKQSVAVIMTWAEHSYIIKI